MPLIRAEIRAAKTIEHLHSVHRNPKSERDTSGFGNYLIFIYFISKSWLLTEIKRRLKPGSKSLISVFGRHHDNKRNQECLINL